MDYEPPIQHHYLIPTTVNVSQTDIVPNDPQELLEQILYHAHLDSRSSVVTAKRQKPSFKDQYMNPFNKPCKVAQRPHRHLPRPRRNNHLRQQAF